MMRNTIIRSAAVLGLLGTLAFAGNVTFTPISPTTVTPGTEVSFQLDVTATAVGGFSTADLIIGSNQANDVRFVADQAWINAFSTIFTINLDKFYSQDFFVSGNNSDNTTSVGTSLTVGIATVDTLGMPEGTYTVQVDSVFDGGFSGLSLNAVKELLGGSGSFTIQCATADGNCDGAVNAVDFHDMSACLQGPNQPILVGCDAYDVDADGDVDTEDFSVLAFQYTGL